MTATSPSSWFHPSDPAVTYRIEVVVTRNGEEIARELITETREEDGWACGHAYWRKHEVGKDETECDWCAGNDCDPTIRPVRVVTCDFCDEVLPAQAFAEHATMGCGG